MDYAQSYKMTRKTPYTPHPPPELSLTQDIDGTSDTEHALDPVCGGKVTDTLVGTWQKISLLHPKIR